MARRMRSPRNELSRADRIASRDIVKIGPRNHLGRNDMIAANPYGSANLSIALTGTAIAGGITEESVVAGGDTVIITVSGDTWEATLGADNAITTAFLAAITGDDAGANGWDDEVALVHGNLVRDSDTQVTLTIPASASYAVAADETVTVSPPASSLTKGFVAPAVQTFDVTADVSIALTGTAVAGGVLESEIVTGSETVIITLTGDTWVATMADDNAITTAFLAAIVGDLADAAGWNAQMTLVHGNIVRTSSTILTLTLPATAGYSITTGNETVTVAPQAASLTGGIVPDPKTFVITEGS